MRINKQTVEDLANLFRRRENLQSAKEFASERNFWLGVINEAFGGSGTRSAVMEAVGGSGTFADLLKRTACEHIEERQKEIDQEIIELGGEP